MSDPPVLSFALRALATECRRRGLQFDELTTMFSSVSDIVERGLGGAHDPATKGRHESWALGLAAMLGRRMQSRYGAFWFRQREVQLGVVLGFPNILLSVAPMTLVEQALAAGGVASLDAREAELTSSVSRALHDALPTPEATSSMRLTPGDYEKWFDPSLCQFLLIDIERSSQALEMPATRAAAELARASRAAGLDAAVHAAVEAKWIAPLAALDSHTTLGKHARDAVPHALRAVESFVRLWSAVSHGGPADEGYWTHVALPFVSVAVPNPSGLLGEFSPSLTRALVQPTTAVALPADAPRFVPRIFTIDDSDVRRFRDALQSFDDDGMPRGDQRDLARARLNELCSLVQRVRGESLVLALRRFTVGDGLLDAATIPIGRELLER